MSAIDYRPDEAKRLEAARIARGFATAKAAADYFSWNYATYTQHENGTRGIGRAVDRYARAFRTSPSWIQHGVGDGPESGVPLKGYIGAGQTVDAIDPGDPEFGDTVEAPADRRPDTVAAIVRGDSMYPTFHDGWLIYWSRPQPPEAMLNKVAVIQLEDDRIMVKLLMRGSEDDLWTLVSVNPNMPPLPDQVVRWAAPIDWIKPR